LFSIQPTSRFSTIYALAGGIEISIRLVRGITADQYKWSERASSLAKGSTGITTPWEMSGMNEGGFLEAS